MAWRRGPITFWLPLSWPSETRGQRSREGIFGLRGKNPLGAGRGALSGRRSVMIGAILNGRSDVGFANRDPVDLATMRTFDSQGLFPRSCQACCIRLNARERLPSGGRASEGKGRPYTHCPIWPAGAVDRPGSPVICRPYANGGQANDDQIT